MITYPPTLPPVGERRAAVAARRRHAWPCDLFYGSNWRDDGTPRATCSCPFPPVGFGDDASRDRLVRLSRIVEALRRDEGRGDRTLTADEAALVAAALERFIGAESGR